MDSIILGLVVVGVTVVTIWGTVRARHARAQWGKLATSLEAKMSVVPSYGAAGVYGVTGTYGTRRWELTASGVHSFLRVQCEGAKKALYLDHQTEKQRQWTGRGRRDRTGKRVPIYGDMVLRAKPEALVDTVIADEAVWEALRTQVVMHLLNGALRPIELRRYWLHSYLTRSPFEWSSHAADLYRLIGALCALAARIEALEMAIEDRGERNEEQDTELTDREVPVTQEGEMSEEQGTMSTTTEEVAVQDE